VAGTQGAHDAAGIPFAVRAANGAGKLALVEQDVFGWLHVDRLELDLPGGTTADGPASRYQRRRTTVRIAALRVDQAAIDARVAAVGAGLAAQGITALTARATDAAIAVSARVADGLAAADVSFRIVLTSAGLAIRALAGDLRVHGHLPTPGPVLAHRIVEALVAATAPGTEPAVTARGLCDFEFDALGAFLWRLLPPAGWRLPAVTGIELCAVRVGRGAVHLTYAPSAQRPTAPRVSEPATRLAAAHDAMRSADELLRRGQLDEAMRGYRALVASAPAEHQPILLERILAIGAARPAWFLDAVELARQALARWPGFAPARAALASIALAKGDPRDAAAHLQAAAQLAAADGDDDGAALAALAAARLLRVLDPTAATALYQQALDHRPGHAEAQAALADRFADEQRWPELIRLLRQRAASTHDRARAARDHVRVAEVLALQVRDRAGARAELERARALDPDEPLVHETAAMVATDDGDHDGAIGAWTTVVALASARRDPPAIARALARRARALEEAGRPADADWQLAIATDPGASEALRGAAQAATRRGDHGAAAGLWQRVASSGLAAAEVARAQLERGRALVHAGELAAAREPLVAATGGRGEVAADAHALLAELRLPGEGAQAAADSLDAAIEAWVAAADDAFPVEPDDGERMLTRAAHLAVERARLLDRDGDTRAAAGWRRAHELAAPRAPIAARAAARALLGSEPEDEVRWLDAILATEPPPIERAALRVRRASLRALDAPADALADVTGALGALDQADADPASALAIRRDALAIAARAHGATGDVRARAVAIAAHAALVDDEGARASAEADAAEAWLAADEAAAALPHGERAAAQLATGPEAPQLRRRVLELLGEAAWRQRAWGDVAAAYRPLLDDAPSLATPVFTYRLAIAADKLGDADAATAALERLSALPEAPGELIGHARRVLADLYERADRPAEAAAVLEALAEDPAARDSDATRAEAYYRAAELHRRRGATEDAIRCLEGALRTVEDHLPALDALELLVRDLGDLERLAVILGRKIAATQRQPARQKALLTRLAQLQLQLGRPDVAVASARRALEIDPSYRPALRVIADDAVERADASTAARAYLALLADGGDELPPIERRAAADALAALIDRHPGAAWHDAAIATLARHQPTVVARTTTDRQFPPFAQLGQDPGNLAPAAPPAEAAPGPDLPADTLEERRGQADAALARGAVAEAADHLDALAAMLGDRGPRKAEVLLELADLAYDRLGDLGRARAAMRAAAAAHGPGARGDATLRVLAAEAAAKNEHADAAETLAAIPAERRTAGDAIALAHAEQRRGHDAAAIAALEQARAAQRLSDEGAMLLFALHQEVRRKTELAAALERRTRAALAADQAGVRAMQLTPGEARARLDDALALYRDALGDPVGAARIAQLIALLPGAGQPPPSPAPDDDFDGDGGETAVFDRPPEVPAPVAPPAAAPTVERRSGELEAVGRQPRELERLAAGAADAGDHASAAELYAGALTARAGAGEPDLTDARRLLRAAAERAGRPEDLARGLIAAAQVTPIAGDGSTGGLARAAALYREAAAVFQSALDDTPGAIGALGRAHLLVPTDAEICAELTDLLRRAGDITRLAEVLERTARSASGTVRARALYDLGVLHRDTWGDVLRSTEMLAAAHRADPALVEVWLPLADALVAGDDLPGARALYERSLGRDDLAPHVRAFIEDRIAVLDRDDAVVSGEVRGGGPPVPEDSGDDGIERPSVEITAVADPDAPAATDDDDEPEIVTIELEPLDDRVSDTLDAVAPLDERVTDAMAAADAHARDAFDADDRITDGFAAPMSSDERAPDAAVPDASSDAPGLEAPSDAPGSDAPRDAPGSDAPALDAPALDAPSDAPALDAPSDAPGPDAPSDALGPDAPSDAPSDAPGPDAPSDAPGLDAPELDTLRDAPVPTDAPQTDAPIAAVPRGSDEPRPARTFAAVSIDSALDGDLDPDPAIASAVAAAPAPDAAPAPVTAMVPDAAPIAARVTAPWIAEARTIDLPRDPDAIDASDAPPSPPASAPAADPPIYDDADRPPHARTTEPLPIAVLPYAAASDAPAPPISAADTSSGARTLPALEVGGRGGLGGTLRGVFGAWRPPAAPPAASHDPERELARALDLTAAGRLDAAIAHAEASTSPPASEDQLLRALALLEDLYAKIGDSDAVTEVIGRQIMATPAAAARAQHWRRRAALYRDVLHREAETYRCLREAHACAPDDADIAYELRAVAMARGEWALTAELLYREIAAASSPRDKGALHLELGLVYDEKLLDPDQARRNYEQALAHDPTIPAARRPLAHLYELAGRHGDAARWYERAAEVARPAEQANLLERAAHAAARAGLRGAASSLPPPTSPIPLVDDDTVADLARRLAAALALGDAATALALARDINGRDPRHPAAFRVLDDRAQHDGDLDGLTALYERRAEADPSERAHLHFALARITEGAGALDVAARNYDRALAIDPEQPGALDARAGLAMRQGDWATADALYARLPPSRATLSAEALLLRRAELAELLGRDADALAKARAAAALQPPRRDAWAQVARLAEKVGDGPTALAAARAQLELIPPGDTAAVTAVRAAAAALCQRVGDRPGAVAWLEQLLADDPHHDDSLAALVELHAAAGNFAGASRALRARVARAGPPGKKAALHQRAGELALAQGELRAADDEFLKASDLDPAHAPTLRRLLDVYWRADDPDALGEVATELALADALNHPTTPTVSLARAAIATAASGALRLAGTIASHLGAEAAAALAGALVELVGRPATAHLSLDGAITGLRDLAARSTGPAVAEVAHAAAALGAPGAPVVAALAT
jgi:Tfp pilus assembly protein PilF